MVQVISTHTQMQTLRSPPCAWDLDWRRGKEQSLQGIHGKRSGYPDILAKNRKMLPPSMAQTARARTRGNQQRPTPIPGLTPCLLQTSKKCFAVKQNVDAAAFIAPSWSDGKPVR